MFGHAASARSGGWRGRVSNVGAGGEPFAMDAAVCRVNGDDGGLWIHIRRDLRARMQLQQAELAQGISPFVLGEHGFAIAMQSLGKWAEQQGADKVSVAVTHVAGTIDGNAAHLVHRVAQEVVTEVCAAETGASIDIRVWQEGAHIGAAITDARRFAASA